MLVVGPGKRDARHSWVAGALSLLSDVSLQPTLLDGDLNLEEHREEASSYPLILALPVSIGSCAEVLDFSEYEHLRSKLRLVVPGNWQKGYFAQVVGKKGFAVRFSQVSQDDLQPPPDLGKALLMAIATEKVRGRSVKMAHDTSERAPGESSVQSRTVEAIGRAGGGSGGQTIVVVQPGGDVVVNPEGGSRVGNAWKNGSFFVIAFVVLLGAIAAGKRAVGSKDFLASIAATYLAFTLVAISLLKYEGKLKEKSFVELLKIVIFPFGLLRGGRPSDQQ